MQTMSLLTNTTATSGSRVCQILAILHSVVLVLTDAVMRACEGCRRRKIKCDAATTNTWPCSACVRLKLHCVRPNGFDSSDTTTYETTTAPSAPATSTHDFSDQALMQATFSQNAQQSMQSTIGVPDPRLFQQQQQQQQQQFDASQMYQVPFPDQQLQYSPMAAQPSAQMINQQFTSTQRMATTTAAPAQNMYPVTPPTMTLPPPQPPTVMSVSTVDSTHMSQPQDMGSPDNGSQGYSNPDLSDLLGALKMSDTGTGMTCHKLKSSYLMSTNIVCSTISPKQGFLPPRATSPRRRRRRPSPGEPSAHPRRQDSDSA